MITDIEYTDCIECGCEIETTEEHQMCEDCKERAIQEEKDIQETYYSLNMSI